MKVDIRHVFFIAVCFLFVACQNAPVQPRESVAIGYTAVESVAELVGIAKRDGHIDAEKRDELLDEVQRAKDALDAAREAINQGEEAEGHVAKARAILTVVRSNLAIFGVE